MTIAVSQAPPVPPDFTLTLAQSALTVYSGSSGQVSLTLTPENGFDSQVNLTCTGLPPGAACTFTPNGITPSADATSSLTLAVAAAGSSSGMLFLPPWLVALFVDKKKRWRRTLLYLGPALLLIAGCGSSSSASSSGQAQTEIYTVQVTATAASGQTHTQPLTLTVMPN